MITIFLSNDSATFPAIWQVQILIFSKSSKALGFYQAEANWMTARIIGARTFEPSKRSQNEPRM
jgi:hypothetical protein